MVTTHETPMSSNAHTNSQASQDHLQGAHDDSHGQPESRDTQAGAQFDHYRENAAQQIEDLAENAQTAARQMEGNDTLGLSRYVTDLAQSMTTLAENMRHRNVEQLFQDAGRLARENPVLFIGGSVALGLVLSRLLKATASSSDASDADHPGAPPSGTSTQETQTGSDLSDVEPSRPYDPISPSPLAAGEVATTHRHDDNGLHSNRPGLGIADSPPANPLNDDKDDDVSSATPSRSGPPKGDI